MTYVYFTKDERACNCCNKTLDNPILITLLTKARIFAGIPFIINSWYRCEKHNEAIGSRPTSSHIKGMAVDIAFKNSRELFKIQEALFAVGFERMGINFESKFIHVDIDQTKIQEVVFNY